MQRPAPVQTSRYRCARARRRREGRESEDGQVLGAPLDPSDHSLERLEAPCERAPRASAAFTRVAALRALSGRLLRTAGVLLAVGFAFVVLLAVFLRARLLL